MKRPVVPLCPGLHLSSPFFQVRYPDIPFSGSESSLYKTFQSAVTRRQRQLRPTSDLGTQNDGGRGSDSDETTLITRESSPRTTLVDEEDEKNQVTESFIPPRMHLTWCTVKRPRSRADHRSYPIEFR